ncbi:diadenylate cyclase [uncultured Methanospirillum sp.]|uniref:diadenylate cyclase n=1 Tax=uncultured Methanospirillum sp. TaxID=262503 RepID=UPI0029C6BC05|nr:diadenylate cyclase [uncultured Methanospirillum sp.]
MNPSPWYCLLLVLLLAVSAVSQGAFADSSSQTIPTQLTSLTALETPPKTTGSPTAKATIAPIHTKEPVIKPPVDQPSATPSGTPTPELPQVRATPTVAKTTTTPEGKLTGNPNDNESASTYFQWGRAYEDAGDYSAAVEEYDRAIAREPYNADAWYHKALCYENLGMWDEAYQAYRFLLTIDPGYPASVNISGSIRVNNTTDRRPVNNPPATGTPLLWIASGVIITGMFAAGFALYHRRKFLEAVKTGDISISTRTIQPNQGPFPDLDLIASDIAPYYCGDPEIFKTVMRLAVEIAREGREGKPVGTAFILGDSDAVLERSRQLILNPVSGHSENDRMITSPDMRENIKELSLVDGAFVIRENGIVEAAGRYISIDTSGVTLPKGFGTRHVSVAAITQETSAIGIVVSESGGVVRVFSNGKVIFETM